MITPKVSIIVPVYNAGSKLILSIDSLLRQTIKYVEIVIVNDASNDDTASVIDELASVNENIVPVHLATNKGVHEARLVGLANSTAPWIGFLDADDFVRSEMYEHMYQNAIEHNADIVVCGSYRVTNERKKISTKLRFKKNSKTEKDVFRKFCKFEFGTGSLWNKLYRREIIAPCIDMVFPWRQSINEDLLINIACFSRAKTVYTTKEILHEYVLNETSVTSTISNDKAYVETFKAAALAIDTFAHLDRAALHLIIDMYRTQLSWSDYAIERLELIIHYESDLAEAVELIYRSYPAALGLLVARNSVGRDALSAVKLLCQLGLSALRR